MTATNQYEATTRDRSAAAPAAGGNTQEASSAVLTSVQGLRAVAATLVLLGHAHSTAADYAAGKGLLFSRPLGTFPGGFGVDLFS